MSFYYHDGTNQIGPFADSQVVELIKNGTIKRDTPMWKEGLPDWCLASTTEFAQHFAQAGWYYHDGTNPVGPFADSQVVELVKNGTIKRDTQIWKDGSPAWCPASTTEFAQHFAKMPPPMAPAPRLVKMPPPIAPTPVQSGKLKKEMIVNPEDDEVPETEAEETDEMEADSDDAQKKKVMPIRSVGWMLLGIGIVGLIPVISLLVAIGCIIMGLVYILGAKKSMKILKNVARHAKEAADKQTLTKVS